MSIWSVVPVLLAVSGLGGLVFCLTHAELPTQASSSGSMLGIALIILILAGLAWNRQRAYTRVREAEQAFRDIYDNINEGVFRSTLDGRMLSANPSLVRFNGYATERELLDAVHDIANEWYVDPNRRNEINQLLAEKGSVSGFVSEVYRHRTRERVWMEESTRLVRDPKTGQPLYYHGTVRDVTETVERLRLQEHYDKIASVVTGFLYQFRIDATGMAELVYASVGIQEIFGLRPDEVEEFRKHPGRSTHPEDMERFKASIEHSRQTLTNWLLEYRIIARDGSVKWVLGHSKPERQPDGSTLWHGFMTDVTAQKKSEERVYQLAYFDPLTRLPNRTKLRDSLDKLLGSEPAEAWNALLFIDLDRFKMLNDSKGHHVGDMLLCEVAKRLRATVDAKDMVARLGGDEFVIMLKGLSAERDAAEMDVAEVATEVLSEIDRAFDLEDGIFRTTASIGAVLFRAGQAAPAELLKHADLAMYESKAAGRNTIRFFEPAMVARIEERVALTDDLRLAIASNSLQLHFQPQMDRTGACLAVEALLRWNHPDRGPISPTEVIALAEQQGLINDLEDWVLTAACRTLGEWSGLPEARDLRLAVNVTAHQLNRPGFVAAVKSALRSCGADPNRLSIELTEHVMLEAVDEVSQAMLDLRAMGVTFALDDFGTGYSSLSYLKRLPIDALKIDRSFVRDLDIDPSDREIVQTIVNIAANMKLCVIAEGVETELQAVLLRQMGCDLYQGYLFGKPMPASDFLASLQPGSQPSSETGASKAVAKA